MYSDTHFHFKMMSERLASSSESVTSSSVIASLLERDCFFALDIGTECEDLSGRVTCVEKVISFLNEEQKSKAKKMIHFSAGIWPSEDAIKNRFSQMEQLKKSIECANVKISAIGECGIDHFRNSENFDKNGEHELFEMQLQLAKEMKLPIIIHTRDGFSDTLECIKNANYDNGIIHCFSYGMEEAMSFLERGWYISFSGAVTYAKKNKIEQMHALLKSIPKEKILLETDSPYLAPVPFRGKLNTPVLVEQVYKFVADSLGLEAEELSALVDENCKKLFSLL